MTRATSVPILLFLDFTVLDLGPMYATDRQTDIRHASSLNAPTLGTLGREHKKLGIWAFGVEVPSWG